MIRHIAGLAAMEHGGKEVYVRDRDDDTVELFVGCTEAVLTPEEMRHLAECLNDAADRAEARQLEQESENETPKES